MKVLVLNHLAPAPDNKMLRRMYFNEMKGFDGEKHFSNDGDIFYVK